MVGLPRWSVETCTTGGSGCGSRAPSSAGPCSCPRRSTAAVRTRGERRRTRESETATHDARDMSRPRATAQRPSRTGPRSRRGSSLQDKRYTRPRALGLAPSHELCPRVMLPREDAMSRRCCRRPLRHPTPSRRGPIPPGVAIRAGRHPRPPARNRWPSSKPREAGTQERRLFTPHWNWTWRVLTSSARLARPWPGRPVLPTSLDSLLPYGPTKLLAEQIRQTEWIVARPPSLHAPTNEEGARDAAGAHDCLQTMQAGHFSGEQTSHLSVRGMEDMSIFSARLGSICRRGRAGKRRRQSPTPREQEREDAGTGLPRGRGGSTRPLLPTDGGNPPPSAD